MNHVRWLVALTALMVSLAAGLSAQNATVVGQETCAACHEAVIAQFDRSAHGQLAPNEHQGHPARCESCHGAGSLHAESGDATLIRTFRDDDADGSKVCVSCHQRDAAMQWAGSAHAGTGVACTSCHKIHQSREVVSRVMRGEAMPSHATAPARKASLAKSETELCFDCHKEQRAQFMSASHHPVREGFMSCSSCHDVHGREVGLLKTEERVNELCTSCHAKHAGPFIFEHAPVEESCTTCHSPHGTVANSLLKQNEPFLCLQCHEMHFHNARLTPTSPVFLAAGGSTNSQGATGFMSAFNTRCTNCHQRIHGSDQPSQGVSGHGSALTR